MKPISQAKVVYETLRIGRFIYTLILPTVFQQMFADKIRIAGFSNYPLLIKYSLHPSYQVLCYAELLENYNHYIENHEVKIIPIVYLHNYSLKVNDVLLANKFKRYYKKAPIYGKENVTQLKEFIKNSIIFGDHLDIVKQIDQSEVKPNKKLLDSLENMIQNNKIYTLLDEQKTVVEIIKQWV